MPSITKKIGAGKIEAGLTGSESRCGVLNSPKPTTFRNCDSWRKVLGNRDFPKGRIQISRRFGFALAERLFKNERSQ